MPKIEELALILTPSQAREMGCALLEAASAVASYGGAHDWHAQVDHVVAFTADDRSQELRTDLTVTVRD